MTLIKNALPTITLENGNTYVIRRTRHILLDIEEMQGSTSLTEEDNKNFAILQDKYARLEKLSKRVKELEDKYFETFDEADEAIYARAKAQYEMLYAETIEFELKTDGVANKVQKETLNKIELVIIQALCYDNLGNTIRDYGEAEKIWCEFVDFVGKEYATEWLLYTFNYLTGADEGVDNDPFMTQAKAKAEQKANMKKGINGAR